MSDGQRFHARQPAIERYRWMMRAFIEFHLDFYRLLNPRFCNDIEMVYLAQALTLRAGNQAFHPLSDAGEGGLAASVVSVSLLAQQLGMPRETARRKLLRLVEEGVAIKVSPGEFALKPGVMAEPGYRETMTAIAELVRNYLNRCIREDYIAIERRAPDGTAEILAPDADPPWQVVRADKAEALNALNLLFSQLFVHIYVVRGHILESDLQQAMISDAVGLFSAEDFYNSPTLRERMASIKVLMMENQKGASMRWVVDQTGFPRETVRRKLKRLVEVDYLGEVEEGRYIFKPGLFLRQDIIDAIKAIDRLIIEFTEQTLRQGIFTVVRGDGAGPSGG